MCKIQHKQQGGAGAPWIQPSAGWSFSFPLNNRILYSLHFNSPYQYRYSAWCFSPLWSDAFSKEHYITALECYQDGLKGTLWKHISAGLLSIYRSPSLGDLYVLMRIHLFLEQFGRSHVSAALPPSIVKVWPGKDHVEGSRVLKSKVGLHENLTI